MTHPSAFFKYLTAKGTESVLLSGRLRWSSPLLFDDPAEFQRMPSFSPALDEAGTVYVKTLCDLAAGAPDTIDERLNKNSRTLVGRIRFLLNSGLTRADVIQQLGAAAPTRDGDLRFATAIRNFVKELTLESTRVLCVTTAPASDAMWKTYAENGRGAILEFRHIPEQSTPLLAARQVVYATELPVLGSGLDFLLYADTRDLRRRCLNAIIYSKKAEWQYQREWRVVTWSNNEAGALSGDYPFHKAELESVTVGVEAQESWALSIRALLAARYPTCRFEWNGVRS